jgi:type II secretory pathway component GspD/PulD (secretin)
VFGTPSVAPAATDQFLTGGLRSSDGEGNSVPTVATITGILTDPQFRVAIHAIEQRSGTDVLAAPMVVTVSGRQAQIMVVDIQQIVTGLSVGSTGSGYSTTGTGGTGGVSGGTVAQ